MFYAHTNVDAAIQKRFLILTTTLDQKKIGLVFFSMIFEETSEEIRA